VNDQETENQPYAPKWEQRGRKKIDRKCSHGKFTYWFMDVITTIFPPMKPQRFSCVFMNATTANVQEWSWEIYLFMNAAATVSLINFTFFFLP
jgi:hypothetical protein